MFFRDCLVDENLPRVGGNKSVISFHSESLRTSLALIDNDLPRISGNQSVVSLHSQPFCTGLAFFKASLESFGPLALSLQALELASGLDSTIPSRPVGRPCFFKSPQAPLGLFGLLFKPSDPFLSLTLACLVGFMLPQLSLRQLNSVFQPATT